MAKKEKDLKKNATADVTPEVTDKAEKNVKKADNTSKDVKAAASKEEIKAKEAKAEATKEATAQAAEAATAETAAEAATGSHAADALKDTVVKVSDDDAREEKKYTKKELKELEKQRKALHKQYHISNWEIIRNYKTYGEAEKKHYRYIFGRRVGDKVWPIFRFIILFGLAFIILYPMLFMISCSFRPQYEMNDPSIMWIPKTFIISNIVEVWQATNMGKVLWNTISVNVICSLLQVVTCAITGYGFARFKFRGRGLLFIIVILQIIVPTQVILIPQFMQFRYFDVFGIFSLLSSSADPGINLTNTAMALYLQAFFVNGIRAGLFIFIFRQFFRGLPKELEDAAHLDGCGPFGTFIRIMVPNAKTSFLTVFIFSLVWYWNDSYVSNMFFSEADTIALQVGNLFSTISSWMNGGTPTGIASDYIVWIEAGCLISLLPILIIYCFLQKQFIEGIERSGITGM